MEQDKILLTLYGAAWSPHSKTVQSFFQKHHILYEYIDLEEEPEKADEAEKLAGSKSLPVVVFPDNTFLVEPTEQELISVCKRLHII